MIIKRLTMHNFGVYASTNTFEFTSKKPIVLIGGLNGRGKTTFLEAVLLSLYGANSFAYKESSFNTYGQYLRSFVNISDGTKKTYVELEFQLNNADHDRYVIKREWDAVNKVRTSEEIHVLKNSVDNEFLTENWAMFIENILPSALSNFFFFDGEKIAELAVDNTNSQLKESIRAMLGISVLDTLGGDIHRNIKRLQKTTDKSAESEKISLLRKSRDDAEIILNDILDEIEKKEKELRDLQEEHEQKKSLYISQGGDVVGKREKLLTEKAELAVMRQHGREDLIQIASGELPLILVRDLIHGISDQGLRERESEVKKQTANYIKRLFEQYAGIKNNTNELNDFMEFVNNETSSDVVDSVYELSDQALYQAQQLEEIQLSQTVKQAELLLNNQKDIDNKSDEVENYLSIDINEEELQKLYKEIRVIEQNMMDCEADLSVLEQKKSTANGEYMKACSEFNKNVSILLDHMETGDDNNRVIKYSEMALRVLNEFSVRLQKNKTGVLGETITSCYKKLANKKNLIEKIVMDPVSLDLEYLDKSGNSVDKSALSAGEKQLMVISILWALAICSKKKLPVIIDTPLSRLDSKHRKSLIKVYFPQASDQTIILSTDSEIDQKYYKLMKENVGDEFTLSYDDENRSTTILNGYFIEE